MPVPEPNPAFSAHEKRLLALLAKLLLESLRQQDRVSNVAADEVALSDTDAAELLDLLQQLLTTRSFVVGANFVESLSKGSSTQGATRETYLAERRDRGRPRSMASRQWAEFVRRLGLSPSYPSPLVPNPMPFDTFVRLEQRLLRTAGVNPRIGAVIVRAIAQTRGEIEDIRTGHRPISAGKILELIRNLSNDLDSTRSPRREITVRRVVGVTTIVSNVSVLFTTRDWTVAGVISAMAGAAIAGIA